MLNLGSKNKISHVATSHIHFANTQALGTSPSRNQINASNKIYPSFCPFHDSVPIPTLSAVRAGWTFTGPRVAPRKMVTTAGWRGAPHLLSALVNRSLFFVLSRGVILITNALRYQRWVDVVQREWVRPRVTTTGSGWPPLASGVQTRPCSLGLQPGQPVWVQPEDLHFSQAITTDITRDNFGKRFVMQKEQFWAILSSLKLFCLYLWTKHDLNILRQMRG